MNMNPKKNSGNLAAQLAFLSILAGAASILFCFSPLIQFPLGMTGIALALISRVYNDGHFMGQAMAGLIASAVGIFFSLITFVMVMFVYQVILPSPTLGPQYNQLMQQFLDSWNSGAIPTL